jgi:hypothetical protein
LTVSWIQDINTSNAYLTTPTNTTTSVVTIDGTQTLTNKTLTSPKINEEIALTTTATKLNYLTGATGTTGTNTTNIVYSTSPTITTPIIVTDMVVPAIYGSTVFSEDLVLQANSDGLSSGKVIVTTNAQSTSIYTGSLVNTGGFANIKDAYFGGKINVAQGIQFPVIKYSATDDPNTLDDYEEGTWDPVLWDNGFIHSTTMKPPASGGINGGFYTKKGGEVTLTASIEWTSATNFNQTIGVVYITGIPFANNVNRSTVSLGPSNGVMSADAGKILTACTEINQSYIVILACSQEANNIGGVITVGTNGIIYSLSVTYFTTE